MKTLLVLTSALFAVLVITPLKAADAPRFEEASVKRTDRCGMGNTVDPGRIALNGDPLKVILREAFNVPMDRIMGPSWLDTDCFVLIAKMPEGATKDQLPAMLQALLVERFKLAAHRESHLRPGYALVVDKDGPKIKQSESSSNAAGPRPGQVTFGSAPETASIKGAMTIARLAQFFSGRLDGPVEDATGMKGIYDIDIFWAREQSPGSADSGASLPAGAGSIFTAVRESLGLRLEPRKQQVDTIVIDHIERVPAEN